MKRAGFAVVAALCLAAPAVSSEPPSPAASARSEPVGPGPHGQTEPVAPLDAAVRAVVAQNALEGALFGIAVVDVDSGRVLAAVNEHLALNPASNAKLYTAGAALAILHAEHRYETTLSGDLVGDTVTGAVTVRGFGDPSLTTADLWDMVRQLKAEGIRRVDGDILVDQRFFDEQTTPPAYDQQPNEWAGFRAPISAVAVDENCVTLTVRPGPLGGAAHLEFDPPGSVDVEGAVRTADAGSADNVELVLGGNGARMNARVSGAVGVDSGVVRYTRRSDDPRLLPGYALKVLLEKEDIRGSREVKLGGALRGRTLARHLSAPLSVLLYALGKQSDNFYAEMVFKSLAGESRQRPARSIDAADAVSRWLAGIGAADAGVVVKNGSGLFDADRATALSLAYVLRWAWREPLVQPEYVAQLAVGGVDGTLHRRFRNESMRRRVRAKTGTLDDVAALSGYVLRDGGRGPIAFAILLNRVGGKLDRARRAADGLVEEIARYAMRP
jgi:D-alanyl-D-alanine carboxypeptidase/D-alanyl-D-alanine-endopeptidase (penicillin-binding protein 4)